MPQTPDTRLGPYQIVLLLGAGSMGEVYRAYDPRLRREVALKVLSKRTSQDLRSEDRFAEEARAAGALSHPNIVSIYDIGHDEGVSYIVSELVDGESLRAVLDRGPIPSEKVCEIGVQVASGLAAAHTRGIVHRDLKPSNIMLTREGWAKIIDFGLAKQTHPVLTGDDSTTSSMTTPGSIVGTLAYMSPEQVRARQVDARSDIFSLGVVLYEMVSGRRPFDGDPFKIMHEIVLQEPAPIQASPALASIIQRCLNKEPAKRFQNAGEVVLALRTADKAQVGPPSIPSSSAVRRNVPWLGLAVGAVTVAVGVALFLGVFWKPKVDGDAAGQVSLTQPVVDERGPAPRPGPVNSANLPPVGPENIGTKQPAIDVGSKPGGQSEIVKPPASPIIETFAGRDWSFSGDGLPAIQVPLGRSYGVASDSEGNIYQTDLGNNLLVQIDPGGRLHVLLGPGNGISGPMGVTVSTSGEVYFAENGRVRKRLPGGGMVLVAGASQPGSSVDGVNAVGAPLGTIHGVAIASDGTVLFAEWGNNRVRRIDAQGRLQTVAGDGQGRFAGDGGAATQASLLHPAGIVLDRQGNLFIADQNNGRVRLVGPDGRIRTVAGRGATQKLLGCPTGVAVNRRNELFIADPCLRQVLVLRGGQLSVVGGTGSGHYETSGDGGPALSASFDQWALAIDERENLLVSGPSLGHVYRIGTDGIFKVVSGNGKWRKIQDETPVRDAVFNSPFRVAVDPAGNLLVSDREASLLYRIQPNGRVYQVAGQPYKTGYAGENTPARDYPLNNPNGLSVQQDGTIVFADQNNNRIRKVTPEGTLRTVAGSGQAAYRGDGGNALEASLNGPVQVSLEGTGNIYIADTGNNRIRKVTPDGKIQTAAGNGQIGFSGDGGPPELAALNSPRCVEAGPDGAIYICDSENHRVRRVLGGVITTIAGNGQRGSSGDGGPGTAASLQLPVELVFGPNRELYILDANAGRIRRLDLSSGMMDSVAGTGLPASGDGSPALQAGLGQPRGLAIDSKGALYVTDIVSGLLRIIRPSAR